MNFNAHNKSFCVCVWFWKRAVVDWPLFEDECYLDSVWHSAWTTKEVWMGCSSFYSSAVFFAAASSSSAGALNSTSLLTSSALPSVALTGLQCDEPSYSFADFVFGRVSLLLLNTVGEGFFFCCASLIMGETLKAQYCNTLTWCFFFHYFYAQKYVD